MSAKRSYCAMEEDSPTTASGPVATGTFLCPPSFSPTSPAFAGGARFFSSRPPLVALSSTTSPSSPSSRPSSFRAARMAIGVADQEDVAPEQPHKRARLHAVPSSSSSSSSSSSVITTAALPRSCSSSSSSSSSSFSSLPSTSCASFPFAQLGGHTTSRRRRRHRRLSAMGEEEDDEEEDDDDDDDDHHHHHGAGGHDEGRVGHAFGGIASSSCSAAALPAASVAAASVAASSSLSSRTTTTTTTTTAATAMTTRSGDTEMMYSGSHPPCVTHVCRDCGSTNVAAVQDSNLCTSSLPPPPPSLLPLSPQQQRRLHRQHGKVYTEEEHRALVQQALDALREELGRVTQEQLSEQFESFRRFHEDYVAQQIRKRECTYIS